MVNDTASERLSENVRLWRTHLTVLGSAVAERPLLGVRMRALREAQGLTLTEVAERCGLSKGYLSTIESGGGANPTLEVLTRIAAALDVTVGELVGQARRRARMELDIPEEQLPPALLELVKERRAADAPLDPHTVRWLAHAKFRGERPVTKEQFKLLLTVVGEA
ncbi:MAG: helix-turn-helix transcriptional regulator [Myxococcales bacterium]|nr:helix-turn-helix transcriptional regulator [Myxococcales bacterium]